MGLTTIDKSLAECQMLRSAPHSFNFDATVIQPSQQRPLNCSLLTGLGIVKQFYKR